MRALALSIALTLAQPGVVAAAQSPAADDPERILATELPTRAEVWARIEEAVDASIRGRPPAPRYRVEQRLEAAYTLARLGYESEALELAQDAFELQQHHSQDVGPYPLDSLARVLLLAGALEEAERVARLAVEQELEQLSRSRNPTTLDRLQLLDSLAADEFLPAVRVELLSEILTSDELRPGERSDIEQELAGALLRAHRPDAAEQVYRRYVVRALANESEIDWSVAAAFAALTEGEVGRRVALNWFRLNARAEGPGVPAQIALMLVELGSSEASTPFLNAGLREGLEWEMDHHDAVSLASGYAAAGNCGVALIVADLAEYLANASHVREAIAAQSLSPPASGRYMPWYFQAEHQPEFRIMRARMLCGARDLGFSGYFDALVRDREHLRSYALSQIYRELETDADRTGFLAVAGVRMATGQIPEFDDQAGYTLAFEAMALDAGGYRQMADDRLLEAWNVSTSGPAQIEGLVWIYHALDQR